MTQTQKIIGTSLFSLLLVSVVLFMVCSGRAAKVGNEEDYTNQQDLDEAYRRDLLSKLEFLESQSGLQPMERDSATTRMVSHESSAGSEASSAESFLTPELFSSMQSQIDELQAVVNSKDREAESLRAEMRDVDYQLSAAETAMSARTMAKSGSRSSFADANDAKAYDSEFGMYYQDALDDYYTRRYDSAIKKFRDLLRRNDQHSLADNCQYWIGESYYAKGDFYQAVAEFQKVYAFHNSNKQDDAQLMIGIAFMKAGEKELALHELSMLVNFSLNKESVKKAEKYLRKLEQV